VGIGGSILLLALGAILAFAVDARLGWLDLNVVGWVLMAAGAIGLGLTVYFWRARRQTVSREPANTVEEPRTEVRPPDY
jgi:hypothetical protein